MSFVHLNVRSHFSFRDATASPTALVKRAKSLGLDAVALTDNANLVGIVEFHKACKAEGIRPIFGASIWTIPEGWTPPPKKTKGIPTDTMQLGLFGASSREQERERERGTRSKDLIVDTTAPGSKLLFLVEDNTGYRNLCQILTIAHRQIQYAPRVTLAQIRNHHEGLFVVTPSEHGPIGELDTGAATIEILLDTFGPDRVFLELCDLGREEDEIRNEQTRSLSAHTGAPTIVTNAVRLLDPQDVVLLDALHATALGVRIGAVPVETDQGTLKTEAELRALFPGDGTAIDRTAEIADRCRFLPTIGKVFLPSSTPPADLPTDAHRWIWLSDRFPPAVAFASKVPKRPPRHKKGADLVRLYFEVSSRAGLEVRLDESTVPFSFADRKRYEDQLERELEVMASMGFITYHLLVAEFVSWAKDSGIAVGPGRGSAAGSLVCWALRITDVNPLQFGLMFERFLNPKRVSMPDIDIDFSQVGRDRVIAHVREKYGTEQTAQILTVGRMKAKAALKDAARVLGVHFNDADTWSKHIEEGPGVKLAEAIGSSEILSSLLGGERLSSAGGPPSRSGVGHPVFRNTVQLALGLEGLPRQTGVHAAGVVITDVPIADRIAVHCDADPVDGDEPWCLERTGMPVTGVEMGPAEDLGLIKFDFLGLKTLDILEMAKDLVKARTGERPDPMGDGTYADPAVYDLLSKGDGLGLFQVESDGMRSLLRRLKPSNFEDLTALLALYRPGPLGSGMVDDFVDRKHGAKIEYPHPSLEEVLKPTYGVIVYQEQVMKIAQILAGYDMADADLLRRAMGKKKAEEMAKQRSVFVEGCGKNGISEEKATQIFDLVDYFSGYGFNKSHSASYAIISYMTAWMKTYYRAEMMAAAMTWEAGDRDKLVAYVTDCTSTKLKVLGPDVTQSSVGFSVEEHKEDLAIRYGLGAIKGIGEAVARYVVEKRVERPFSDFQDFLDRIRPNRSALKALAAAGAFDALGIERWTATASNPKKRSGRVDVRQDALFPVEDPVERGIDMKDLAEEGQEKAADTAEGAPWGWTRRLDLEREVLGCWLSGHPLDAYPFLYRTRSATTIEVPTHEARETLRIAGAITKIHRIKNKADEWVCWFNVTDEQGSIEVTVRPAVYPSVERHIRKNAVVEVFGALDRDQEQGKFVVTAVEDADELRRFQRHDLDLHLDEEECDEVFLGKLKALLDRFRAQSAADLRRILWLHLRVARLGTVVVASLPGGYDPCRELFEGVERLTGRAHTLRGP